MIRNWLIYVLAVATVLVFTIMYGRQSGFLLLILSVVLPILYAFITYIFSKNIVVGFVSEPSLHSKDKKMIWQLRFDNLPSFLEGSRVRIPYLIQTGQGKVCEQKTMDLCFEKGHKIEIEFQPGYAGMYELKIDMIQIYSSFSLLSRIIDRSLSDTFFVMPKYHEEFANIDQLPMQKEGESDAFMPFKEGNDPTEILGFRGYQPGDKKNRINWKVTIKTGQFMVPQYGFPIACDIGIMVDISQIDVEKVERILEIIYALCIKLTARRRMCYIVWENDKSGCLERKEAKKEEDVYEILYAIASTINSHSICLEDLYAQQYEAEYLSQVYFICQREETAEVDEVAAKLHTENLKLIEL